MTKKIVLTVLIILLPIINITYNIDSVIFNKEMYLKYENQINNKEEIIINLLDYFKNNERFIEQEGFSQKERHHFLDVKKVIRNNKSILLFSMMLSIMLLMYLVSKTKKKVLKYKLSSYFINGGFITIILVIFIYLLSQDFNYFFNLIHSFLFKTGTWVFPSNSLSIKLFPLELFKDFSKLILIRIILVSIILISVGIIYKKFNQFKIFN